MIGRPPKFDNVEQLQSEIDSYFDKPPTKEVITKDGLQFVSVVTITGLALHLGFESRQSLYDYESNDKFSYTIKRARLHVENNYETQLQYGNSTGAIFALKNMSWSDKTQTDIDVTTKGKSMQPTFIFNPVGTDFESDV
jgi:hypothetical protein